MLKTSQPPVLSFPVNTQQKICGTISDVKYLPEKRLRIILSDLSLPDNPLQNQLAGKCAWTWENAPLLNPLPGQKICITRSIKHGGYFANSTSNITLSSEPDIYWRIWSNNEQGNLEISGKPFFLDSIRQTIFINFLKKLTNNSSFTNTYPELTQGQSILCALLFGDRRFLTVQIVQNFATATLAHSLALSGQHLAMAGVLAFFFIWLFSLFRSKIFLFQPRKILVGLASIPMALTYLWIGGAPASLIRATSMLSILVIASMTRVNLSLLDVLVLALSVIILFKPLIVLDVGFQLSALCICIIALTFSITKYTGKYIQSFPKKIPDSIKAIFQILILSLTIQFALLPLTLTRFDLAGYWFFLNIVWLPLLGFFILPLAAFGLIFSLWEPLQPFSHFILALASCPGDLFSSFLHFLDAKGVLIEPMSLSPHWTTFIAFILLICAVADGSAYRNKQAFSIIPNLLLGALLFLAVGPVLRIFNSLDKNLYVEALDVGQAQAILITLPENNKIVIDGGGSKSSRFDPGKNIISPLIKDNSPPELSAIINSHPDLDHVGGLFYLLENYNAPLFVNGRRANSDIEEKWEDIQKKAHNTILAKGDKLVLGDPADKLELEVLHPPKGSDGSWEGNAASLVMRLTKNNKGIALFTGDAEKNVLKELVKSGQNIEAQIVFAPHHGSDRSFFGPFYEKVKPDLVLVNCGYENRWNYPGKRLIKFLENKKITILDTGNNGKITVQFTSNDNEEFNAAQIDTSKNGNIKTGI